MKKLYPFVIAFSIAAVFFLIGYWLLVLPQVRTLSAAQASLDASTAGLSKNETSDQKKSEEARFEAVKTKAGELLPASDNQYDLSVQVEALAKKQGLTLSAFSLSDTAPAKVGGAATASTLSADIKKITVTTTLSGSYTAIQQFVTGFTSLDRIVQIDQLTISSDSTTGQISAQIVGFAYYLSSDPATPSS